MRRSTAAALSERGYNRASVDAVADRVGSACSTPGR
jgi:AcrR family transcriptional regulator